MDSTFPKGIIFDLDDTILAFDTVADLSWEQTLNQFKQEFQPIEPEAFHKAIKLAAREFWSDPCRHLSGRLNLEAARTKIVSNAMYGLGMKNPDLVSNIVDAYGTIRTELIHPIPGAIETLVYLKEHNVPMILATNGDAGGQRYKIEKFQLQSFFNVILIEGECGFGKPDERVYRRALDELSLPAEDVWMVGDNLEWEVIAPQKLGIKGVWVDYRGSGLPKDCTATPYKIVASMKEVFM